MFLQADYTTVQDVRATYLAAQETADDALISRLITITSREIDALALRHFQPVIKTREYDVPRSGPLVFDDDLLEVTTLSNGDSTVIAATQYQVYPLNVWPKERLEFKGSATVGWEPDAAGDYDGAGRLAGVWGHHRDYDNAWVDGGITLSGSSGSAATALTFSATVYAGELLKIDTEYLGVSVSGSAATVKRGVNGSTSGSHATAAVVYEWDFREVGELCRQAVAAYYRLRANPIGETITIDGQTFSTPKDVRAFMDKALRQLSLKRIYQL